MTRRLGTGVWLLAAALLAGMTAVRAQVQSVDTSQPIVIKSSKPSNPKTTKFLGEFISSTPSGVTVRDRGNSYSLRTFSYGPQARSKMQQISAKGGYRFGDKIEIEYAVGSTVALRIKGKPSSSKVN